jgi:predicted amidohydrolase
VIESLARRRFKNGLMPDTISTDLVEHHTMAGHPWTPAADE